MALITKIPSNSRVRFPVNLFESNPFAGGEYHWQPNAGNTDQVVIENLNPAHIYVVEKISVFANVSESDWLESMLSAPQFPRFHFALERSPARSIFPEPFRCVNYVDNLELLIYFGVQQSNDRLIGTFFGEIEQVAGMVGKETIKVEVAPVIYEITDSEWIRAWRAGKV